MPKSDALDDLEALRTVVTALEPFDARDRERIVRWACEKLSVAFPATTSPLATEPQSPKPATNVPTVAPAESPAKRDLRTFIAEKAPTSDTQFATAVAYYYQFEAPESDRKSAITAADLIEACRLADRTRLQNPGQTLRNAIHAGLLDRAEQGAYKINAVGENLVAMALPTGASGRKRATAKSRPRPAKKTGRGAKPSTRKKASKATTGRAKRT